jgi:hypothetical protein
LFIWVISGTPYLSLSRIEYGVVAYRCVHGDPDPKPLSILRSLPAQGQVWAGGMTAGRCGVPRSGRTVVS